VTDAVVVGAGPNGLVAANVLADAGWDVLVVEEQAEPGGAVRTADGPAPGFRYDLCSAFYPLGAASPALRSLELERYGLRWVHADHVLAHPLPDGRAAILDRDLDTTAASVEELGAGDGDAWRRLYGLWQDIGPELLDALFVPFPPVLSGARLTGKLGLPGLLRFLRFTLLPVRRLSEEEFSGPGGPLLLAGCSLHADLMPESAGSTVFGWLLSMLGQQVGFPVPQGGAGQLTAALVRRLEDRGGRVLCGHRVDEVLVRGGRAVGVRVSSGEEIPARKAVLADVPATALYGGLVRWEHLPARLRDDIRRFQWDFSTVKVDWALNGPVPWTSPGTARAGTIHIASDLDEMTMYTANIATGTIPDRPFLLVGQMTTTDPSRSPAGTESLWAYTHVPREVRADAAGELTGRWNTAEKEIFADRMQARLEELAPGFSERVRARQVSAPEDLSAHDASLVGGAVNGGTTAVHQQLLFRPVPGLGRPETPVTGLYLASASAHPGGAVHGACGSNAARAALRASRTRSQGVAARLTRLAIGEQPAAPVSPRRP
jgi:phytoene dehydrogenase-like protein